MNAEDVCRPENIVSGKSVGLEEDLCNPCKHRKIDVKKKKMMMIYLCKESERKYLPWRRIL